MARNRASSKRGRGVRDKASRPKPQPEDAISEVADRANDIGKKIAGTMKCGPKKKKTKAVEPEENED